MKISKRILIVILLGSVFFCFTTFILPALFRPHPDTFHVFLSNFLKNYLSNSDNPKENIAEFKKFLMKGDRGYVSEEKLDTLVAGDHRSKYLIDFKSGKVYVIEIQND